MTYLQQKPTSSIQYPSRAIERAERALRCSPFSWHLLAAMRSQSVTLGAIAVESGRKNKYTGQQLSELAAESSLLWLIKVGILRREVDGQGITDGFRLTPLGRYLVEKWQDRGGEFPPPSFLDRLCHALNRWLRLPI